MTNNVSSMPTDWWAWDGDRLLPSAFVMTLTKLTKSAHPNTTWRTGSLAGNP